MKHRFLLIPLLLITCILISSVPGIPKTQNHDRENDSWWQEQVSRQSDMMKTGDFRLLLTGDSITRRFETTGSESWDLYLKPHMPLNFGIDGDTTEMLLYRLGHAPYYAIRPEICTVLIGVNDLIRGDKPVMVAENIHDIVLLLSSRYPDSRVYLFCIFPAEQPPGKIREAINKTNSILKKYQFPNQIRVLDLTNRFTTKDGSLTDGISADQLHLSGKGYRIWGEVIDDLITNPDEDE